ncbi:MAG: T9SS type A sorting domain-containing protein [Bacteroidota bacterium]|nr:T9SS type A sorting domain-containing protein [Bacteroidota bacterium]
MSESNENNNIFKFGTFNFTNQGVGIKENISNILDISVYPNPATEKLKIMLDLKEKINGINYSLMDISGHDVLHNSFETDELSIKKQVILPSLAEGIYF